MAGGAGGDGVAQPGAGIRVAAVLAAGVRGDGGVDQPDATEHSGDASMAAYSGRACVVGRWCDRVQPRAGAGGRSQPGLAADAPVCGYARLHQAGSAAVAPADHDRQRRMGVCRGVYWPGGDGGGQQCGRGAGCGDARRAAGRGGGGKSGEGGEATGDERRGVQMMPRVTARQPVPATAAITIVALAACWCLYRGPMRAMGEGYDWAMVYGGARVWLAGGNPYAHADVLRTLAEAGSTTHQDAGVGEFDLLYPPTTYLLVSPFGAMNWRASQWAWLAVNLLALGALILGLIRLNRLGLRSPVAMLVAAGVLTLAPLHTVFANGQTALVVTSLGGVGLALHLAGRSVWAGVMIALSTCLKPQLGLAFVAPLILTLDVRALAALAVTGLAVIAAAVIPLQLHTPTWLDDLRQNLQRFTTTGPGNPTPSNPNSYQLINLHHPLHEIFSSRAMVGTIAACVGGTIAFTAVVLAFSKQATSRRVRSILLVSACAAALLMASYHRGYDAVILAIPLSWAISELACQRDRALAALTLGLIAIFFVPGSGILQVATQKGWLPQTWTASRWWQTGVVPHQAWALLAIGLVILIAMARLAAPTTSSESPGTEADR